MVDAKIDLAQTIEVKRGSLLYQMPLFFLAIGIGALVYWTVIAQENHVRAMYAYLFGFATVLSLVLGCLSFVLIQHLTRAGWSVVLRRLAEAAIAVLPLFILFFIPIAVYAHDLYPWLHSDHIDDILAKKLGYLNEPFFLIRSFSYLLLWSVMGVGFYRVSLAQDDTKKFYLTKYMQIASAPCIVVYGLTVTFAAFDWIMSLQPHWYSTIFGVYFFAGCVLFGQAFITLMAMLLQKASLLKGVITQEHYHDLGKLMFGFTVFWAYIGFSQFMLYWYANIPEEVEFYAHRLTEDWGTISWALPITNFFIPFFGLMSRTLKRIKLVLAINCLWVIFVHLIDLYWLILPTYHDAHLGLAASPLFVSTTDILATLGLMAIFLGVFLFVLCRRKVLAIGDPRLFESLAFENY